MSLENFQSEQQKILYANGEFDSSHDMFIDLDDMWRGCLRCKTSDKDTLKEPCKNAQPPTS